MRTRELIRNIKDRPQKSTERGLTDDDLRRFVQLQARNKGKRVRVYSSWGFVPNSYRYRCDIQWIETADNEKSYRVGWSGAQRSGGSGAQCVVDNRLTY